MGNGTGQALTEINVSGGAHTQNTDTGTTNQTFSLDSDSANPVILKNSAGILELKNSTDTDYVDLTVKNLTVKGLTTTIESETLKIADNIIELNSNVTTGTPTENAGIEVKRGSETEATLIFDESTDVWKAGIKGAEKEIAFKNDLRIGTKELDETNLVAGDILAFDGTKWVRATGISGGTF